MKIPLLGVELFNADGRTDGRIDIETDITNLKLAIRNFSNGSKHCLKIKCLAFQRSNNIIQKGTTEADSHIACRSHAVLLRV
jgi:hypothetical protein